MNTNTHNTIDNIAGPEVTVRVSRADDARALRRLAITDSAEPIEGAALICELDGRIVAAMPVGGGAAIADPFTRTAGLVEMLELRLQQIHQAQLGNVKRFPGRIRRSAPHVA